MKPQETVSVVTTLAPAVMLAPPILIAGAIVGIGLLWLLAEEKEPPQPKTDEDIPLVSRTARVAKRITREDVAEALAYGERAFNRKEAVAALESLGFRKTAAYKALAEGGKFASMIEFAPDGQIEWRG